MNVLLSRWPLMLMLIALVALATTSSTVVLAQDEPPGIEESTVVTVAETEASSGTAEALMGLNTDIASLGVALDTIWVMVAGFLVFFMQVGFAMVEAGLTRAKNAVNICMKNLLDFCFGSLAFWAVGFALMFGGGSAFVGQSGFFLQEEMITVPGDEEGSTTEVSNFDSLSWTNVPLETKFFFQLVFAATAATIVSGAMAERTKFPSYMAYSFIVTALIYPVSGHWIWGGGWLGEMGFWDFAGSTTVHSVGAWLALVGSFALGPRRGKYDAEGHAKAIPGHNIVLVMLGVFILWLGWFGFNPGSTMSADAGAIAHITCTTNLAAAAGALAATFVSRAMFGKWEATMALNGALAGLVSITAACAWVSFPSAVVIGAIGGALVVLSVVFLDQKLKVDDPVGAISVHGTCGAWGTLAVALFAMESDGSSAPPTGLLLGGGAEQLVTQAIGVGSVFLWCMVTGAVCFFGLKALMGLRVSEEEEYQGLDVGEHGNEAYHGFQFTSQG